MSYLGSKNDNKEIVLFLNKNVKYDYRMVAKDITDRYQNVGDAIIPDEASKMDIPLFYYKDDKDMLISIDGFTVSINVTEKYFDNLSSIIFDIADAFNDAGASLVRIGYISNIFLSNNKIDRVKKVFLNDDLLGDINDFNIGWYHKMKASFGDINCWERFITDKEEDVFLVSQYDFNTIIGETFDFELKSIKEFIKISEEYIESRLKLL